MLVCTANASMHAALSIKEPWLLNQGKIKPSLSTKDSLFWGFNFDIEVLYKVLLEYRHLSTTQGLEASG